MNNTPERMKSPENSLEVWDSTVKGLTTFKEYFHPKAEVIYYPSCGSDISPAKVFPESRIIFLDGNEVLTLHLTNAGYEAHTAWSQDFTPDSPVDILILINPMATPDKPYESVQEGGFVICNDYHHSVEITKARSEFTLVAALDGEKIVTEGLETWGNTIETDRELLATNKISYLMISKTVKALTGKESDVVSEYKKIFQSTEAKDNRDGTKSIQGPDGQYMTLYPLPTKQLGGLYVFQKKTLENKK